MAVLEVKKSNFIGLAFSVHSVSEVEQILSKIRTEHKKATHVCYAYRIVNDTEQMKQSDDGEPSGTAGKPILSVIQKQNRTNILVVVVRYYGGIKLGAGGLVRAYTKTAAAALAEQK